MSVDSYPLISMFRPMIKVSYRLRTPYHFLLHLSFWLPRDLIFV